MYFHYCEIFGNEMDVTHIVLFITIKKDGSFDYFSWTCWLRINHFNQWDDTSNFRWPSPVQNFTFYLYFPLFSCSPIPMTSHRIYTNKINLDTAPYILSIAGLVSRTGIPDRSRLFTLSHWFLAEHHLNRNQIYPGQ